MDKAEFLDQLIDVLRKEASYAVRASQDAADYATNEEAHAESKWDTQGLEASYLAAGQAGQARQLTEAIEALQSNRSILLGPKTDVSLGALFTCDFGDSEESFFFSNVAGGQVIAMESKEVTVITAHSPLAGRVRGLKAGEVFALSNGKSGSVVAIE